MPRKHLIASKINAKQQNKAKLLQKLSYEIKAAAKSGGTNLTTNTKLKLAVEKALKNNLSRESIDKNIYGSIKKQEAIEFYEFEIFGSENLKIIITALTDNKKRTLANIKGYINKFNGQIAKIHAVKIYFHEWAFFLLPKQNFLNEETLIELLIDYQIQNIVTFDDGIEIQVGLEDFDKVKTVLKQNNYKITDVIIKWISNDLISVSNELLIKLKRFLEQVNDDQDLENVYFNLIDDQLEQIN